MLSIGEFSKICRVSSKTLRYYEELGLIKPVSVHQQTGYRYYSIDQLETMLMIARLKSYHFSLEEIKEILGSENQSEKLQSSFLNKKKEMEKQIEESKKNLEQLNQDLFHLKEGKPLMSYLDDIDVELVEVKKMTMLFIRKMVMETDFVFEYQDCFSKLFTQIQQQSYTMAAPPMVLFHSGEYTAMGLDSEFAIPVKESSSKTREFDPGLCLKTVVHGSYSQLSDVYARQQKWMKENGFVNSQALYEVYVNDPSVIQNESELITEVYCPIRKEKR